MTYHVFHSALGSLKVYYDLLCQMPFKSLKILQKQIFPESQPCLSFSDISIKAKLVDGFKNQIVSCRKHCLLREMLIV